MEYRVISADSHVIEPQRLWLDRIDQEFRQAAPRVERIDGVDHFVCPHLPPTPMAAVGHAGANGATVRSTYHYEAMRPGSWDPVARLKDMDADHVDAEVVYPTFGIALFKIEDGRFLQACARAYNDWAVDFVSHHPARLKAVAMLPTDDIAWAAAELQRTARLGLVGAMAPGVPPPDKAYHTPHYDPLWAAAEASNIPVSLHVGTGRRKAELDTVGYYSSYGTAPHLIAESITDMVFSGVFERFPKLRIISAENDICWIANVLERVDSLYQRRSHLRKQHLAGGLLPSDIFREHVYATFIQDRAGIKVRHEIGVENIMWSSDYPHPACTWPNSEERILEHFFDVPAEETRKMVRDNVMRLYGFNESRKGDRAGE